MVTQQPDLERLLVEECRREPLDPFAQDGAGDRSRIDLVGLAAWRSPRREIPIIFGGTRTTCSPAPSSARSSRAETPRQSSRAQTLRTAKARAQRSARPCPSSSALTSSSPTTTPVSASTAASAYEPEIVEQLAALTRMITESPSLLAREQQIFAGYTGSLAALIAESEDAPANTVEPWVAANATMGAHRALVDYTRRRILEGARHPDLAHDVRAQADKGARAARVRARALRPEGHARPAVIRPCRPHRLAGRGP